MCDIGKKMYLRRKELGLTLEEVGDAVGVGKSTVRRWENGMIKNMGRDKIIALVKVLQMSPVEFVPADDPYESLSKEDRADLEALHQDPQLRMLFDAAKTMNQTDKSKVLKICGIIKDELYGE